MKRKIFIWSTVVILIDQLVKMLIINNLNSGDSISIIDNFFNITYVENVGAAWGLFAGSRWFLIIIALLAIYAIIKYFLLDVVVTKIEFISYILILGGIVSNMIDRIIHGYVIDYFEFNMVFYQFPVFNLADTAIVIGTGLVILHLIMNALKQRRKK